MLATFLLRLKNVGLNNIGKEHLHNLAIANKYFWLGTESTHKTPVPLKIVITFKYALNINITFS